MIYAVTGAGPRTGTSWVMDQLHQARLPVYWTPHLVFPSAGYEADWYNMPRLNNVIVKVWPNKLHRVPVSRMIVLRREREAQIESIARQIEREQLVGYTINQKPLDIIRRAEWILDQCKVPRREYRTEELNEHIAEIIEWLAEPFEQMRAGSWQQQ